MNDNNTSVGLSGDVYGLIDELIAAEPGGANAGALSVGQIKQLQSTLGVQTSQATSTIRTLVESEITKMFDGIDPIVSKDDFIKRLNTLFTFKTNVKMEAAARINPLNIRSVISLYRRYLIWEKGK